MTIIFSYIITSSSSSTLLRSLFFLAFIRNWMIIATLALSCFTAIAVYLFHWACSKWCHSNLPCNGKLSAQWFLSDWTSRFRFRMLWLTSRVVNWQISLLKQTIRFDLTTNLVIFPLIFVISWALATINMHDITFIIYFLFVCKVYCTLWSSWIAG